ncbi:MAG: hypothetical protein WDZ77_02960 [Candidatus Pacearchaeota archaeon]
MFSKEVLGWGAIVVGILMGLIEFMDWSGQLNYLWAVLVLLFGIGTLNK